MAEAKPITHKGMTKSLRAWSIFLGGPPSLVSKRIRVGWDPILAVSTPPPPPRFSPERLKTFRRTLSARRVVRIDGAFRPIKKLL